MQIHFTDALVLHPKEAIGIGEISRLGSHTQGTCLGSCVSVILSFRGVGCISHIYTAGRRSQCKHPYESPKKVFDYFEKLCDTVKYCEPHYSVVGGCESLRHIYDATIEEAILRHIDVEVLDVLGNYSRSILFDPPQETLFIRRTPSLITYHNSSEKTA